MHENKVLEINITLLQIFRYSSKRNREIATFHEYFCLHALSYKSVQRGLGKIVLQFHLLSVVTSYLSQEYKVDLSLFSSWGTRIV